MTKQEILLVAQKIATINGILGFQMTNEAVMYQATLLQDLNFQKVMDAYDVAMQKSKTGKPPLVSHIREIVNPEIDSRFFAVELARKIDGAISKFGYNWAMGDIVNGEKYYLGGGKYHWTFKEAVIAELGDLAWHSICMRGGWENVRNSANEMEEGMFIAQMRDQLQASYALKKQGVDVTKIEMITHDNRNETQAIELNKKLQIEQK